jgi:Putative peptidoglycan binding domain
MKPGRNVILVSGLTLAAMLCSLPAAEAVSPATTTSPSSRKPVRGTATTSHRTRPHTAGTHTTGTHAQKPASHRRRTSQVLQTGKKPGHKTTRHKVVAHRSTAYTRLAHMQMDPARVENIQRALISAGDLHGTPTGRWDAETREAMARYQTANGFGVTGLPDAKSLMKLGLGPHPLPPQLDKTRTSPASSVAPASAASLPSNPAVEAPASRSPASAEPPSAAPPVTTDPPVKR